MPVIKPLTNVAERMLPRILTQVCRDPSHPAYGCFDRNWWHYKVRDFPSIILQQGGYAVLQAAEAGCLNLPLAEVRNLAAGSSLFWNKRAILHGAFEEYYPWEQGYPPLAFSTLAVAKLVAAGVVSPDAVRPGMEIAARQLLQRFEPQAANQQVAGLAALLCLSRLYPDLVPATDLEQKIQRTLELQNEEGWYEEYGGPDTGYLSVAIDCLFDAFDALPDNRLQESILKACRFLSSITGNGSVPVGLHNARNTDYLVPYGMIRASVEMEQDWPEGRSTVRGLFARADEALSPLPATDDRYLCHYIGHSVFRAVRFLKGHPQGDDSSQDEKEVMPRVVHFSRSGHSLFQSQNISLLVSSKKGGILTLHAGLSYAADFGWIIQENKKPREQFITHWWNDAWELKENGNSLLVDGPFFLHRETESSPWKHFALRFCSLIFGRKLIAMLKSRLIFHRPSSPYRLRRKITLMEDGVLLEDAVWGLSDPGSLHRAPRPSKRHVASADSFHLQDFVPESGFEREEKISVGKDSVLIKTRISLSSQQQ